MKEIFESEDLNKFLLFSYIERAPKQTVTISDIQDQYRLSQFKATKLIEELMNDFKNFDLSNFFSIEKHKRKYVYSKNGLDSINRLFWIYGRRSLKLGFLDYFIKNPGSSVEDFSLEYYVSLSKAYSIRNQLFEYLDFYNVNFIRVEDLEEYKIRYFLSSIYFSIFKEYEFPFEEEYSNRAEIFLSYLRDAELLRPLNSLEISRIKFYLYVTLLRIETQHELKKDISLIQELDDFTVKKFKSIMKLFLGGSSVNVNAETMTLMNYLISLELINNSSSSKINKNFQAYLRRLFTCFFGNNDLENYKEKLTESLTPLFIKAKYYKHIVQDDLFFSDMSVFTENYSDIFKIATDFLSDPEVIMILGDYRENKSFLMELILKVIDVVNLNKILKEVVVSVNFSISKEYNHFISTTIANLPFSNLTVKNEYSESTDLYLTDTLTENIGCYCIVWNSPPTGKDWEIFGNVISKIKETK